MIETESAVEKVINVFVARAIAKNVARECLYKFQNQRIAFALDQWLAKSVSARQTVQLSSGRHRCWT